MGYDVRTADSPCDMPDIALPLPVEIVSAYRLHAAGQLAEAEAAYRAILASRPDQTAALDLLARLCRQRGDCAEALRLYAAVMKAEPGSAEAASNHAVVLTELGRPAEALASLGRALTLKPDCVAALYNRGNALLALDRHSEALASFDRALALDPRHVNAHYNRGNALRELRLHDAALASYRDALALSPDRADIHVNAALTLLRIGKLAEGLREYEWRHRIRPLAVRGAIWQGEAPVCGTTIFIHAEQGFGDTLQFIRYASLLAQNGARVFAAVPASLKPLIAGMPGITALTAGDVQPRYDLHCPMMSLPLAFGTQLATIPANVPYLAAPPDRVRHWAGRLPPSGNLKVGLAWSGSTDFAGDRQRSLALARLAPLLAVPGIDFVALQRDLAAADLAILETSSNVTCLGSDLRDFADTAAIVGQLDLVITVDTALAHLAGAMARPVWVMLPYSPDWRWFFDRPDSPWYPTARLFRQHRRGDWDDVVARAATALASERAFGATMRQRLIAAGRYDEALAAADQAVAQAHESARETAAAYHDRGAVLAELGRYSDAHKALARAIEIVPASSAAIFNQGLIDLTLGNFADGWPKYEHRFAAHGVPPPIAGRHFDPAEATAGKTVVVAAEQGFGDTFMFARYVLLLAASGARVVLSVSRPLVATMKTLPGAAQIVTPDDPIPLHDFAIPLLSLPHAYATRLDTIPAQVPYLAADPDRIAFWRDKLPDSQRIGLFWSGTQSFAWSAARSIPFALLAPLLAEAASDRKCKTTNFVSLQRELPREDEAALRGQPNIVHFGKALQDFADTAAIIAALDLVITIDSAVAHLAGAMARPVWLLLPFVPDFRWLLEREDSPWYPTVRLFRQPAPGDWTAVIARVGRELGASR